MDKGDNPYQLLDVPQNADYVTIKKAYRRLALDHHPDRGGDTKKFAKIANAYEIISDPKQRHNYDLQQRHGGTKGYDPKAPEFTSTRDDYDPSKPDSNPTTNTTNTSSNKNYNDTTTGNNVKYYHPDDQGDDVEETWTTYTTMKNGVPVTQTRKNKTYTRTTPSSQPTTRTSTTSTTTSAHHFQMDPMELFRQHFPEGAKKFSTNSSNNNNKSPRKTTTTTTTNSMKQPIPMRTNTMNSPSCAGAADDDIMGMASGTRTVTHPDGRQELITETVITRADGSTETKVESKMLSAPIKSTGTTIKKKPSMMQPSIPMTTTTYYPSTTTTTTNRSISSPSKPTKSSTTTTTMYPTTTTTKGVKKITSATPTTMTTKSLATKKSIPVTTRTSTTTTYQASSPKPKTLTNTPTQGKNRHVVIKNGKPVTVYTDD